MGMAKVSEYTARVLKRTTDARKAAGFKTQTDIAKALGISRERYAKYETERIIHKEFIAKFCELTDISESWLISGKVNIKGDDLPPDIQELVDAYVSAAKDTQEWLLNTARQIRKKPE